MQLTVSHSFHVRCTIITMLVVTLTTRNIIKKANEVLEFQLDYNIKNINIKSQARNGK